MLIVIWTSDISTSSSDDDADCLSVYLSARLPLSRFQNGLLHPLLVMEQESEERQTDIKNASCMGTGACWIVA